MFFIPLKLSFNLRQRKTLSKLCIDLAKANLLFSAGTNFVSKYSFPTTLTMILTHAIVALILTYISLFTNYYQL